MSFIRLNTILSGLQFSELKCKPTIRIQQIGNNTAIVHNFVRYRFKWIRPVGPPKKRDEVPTLRQYLQSLKPQKPIKRRRLKKKITPLNPYAKLPAEYVPLVQQMIKNASDVPVSMRGAPLDETSLAKEFAEERAKMKELRRAAIHAGKQKSKKELEEEAAKKAAREEAARKKREEAEKAKQQQESQQQSQSTDKSSTQKTQPSGEPKVEEQKVKTEEIPKDLKEWEMKALKMFGLDRLRTKSPKKQKKYQNLKELVLKSARELYSQKILENNTNLNYSQQATQPQSQSPSQSKPQSTTQPQSQSTTQPQSQ